MTQSENIRHVDPDDEGVYPVPDTVREGMGTAAAPTREAAGRGWTPISRPDPASIPLGRQAFGFEIHTQLPAGPDPDGVDGYGRNGFRHGRTGVIHTPHGDIHTPCFIPVATQATMKGVLPEQMKALGSQALLSNAFHLFERPGEDLVDEAGGVAAFEGWYGPTFTDSGGFQVLSLGAGFKKTLATDVTGLKRDDVIAPGKKRHAWVDEEGVTFKSPLSGVKKRFSAEISMQIQHKLGADIMFSARSAGRSVAWPSTSA
jgi:queuine tRNA-ribosyltransferase